MKRKPNKNAQEARDFDREWRQVTGARPDQVPPTRGAYGRMILDQRKQSQRKGSR